MKKLVAVLLAVSLLAAYAVPVSAAETSGKCGDNLTWTLVDKVLTISGTGTMYDYSRENPAPWSSVTKNLQRINIEHGVTSIGNYAFYFEETFINVYVTVAGSVSYIGDHAFHVVRSGCKFDFYLLGEVPEIGQYPFQSIGYIYVVNWDAAAIKSLHLADGVVKNCTVKLNILDSKQLVSLNEPLKAELFHFEMYDQHKLADYIPRQLTFSDYDNSTYGQKTVTMTADGFTFTVTYFVTDGTNHLDLINVEFPALPEYDDGRGVTILPTITMGTMELVKDDHYDLRISAKAIGNDGYVTVKGKGVAQGFEKTFYFPVLKKDLSNVAVYSQNQDFTGMPVDTHYSLSSITGKEGRDYEILYQNNINTGRAGIRAVGKGNYCGEAKGSFVISLNGKVVELSGECIGKVDGELSDNIPYYEQIIPPAHISFRVDCSIYHMAAYSLYKVNEEDVTLIAEYVSDVGNNNQLTNFNYDFKSVYEDAADVGGETYLLSYSWLTEKDDVYAGAVLLGIPSKVADATSITMEHVENDGDFRKEFFHLYGNDGVLGAMTWDSSNPAVATVENGTVTMKKPGTVMISGQCGDMVETYELTVPQLDLTEGIIFDYSETNGARVIYNSRQLIEGTDYVLSVKTEGKGVTVTATGVGLFAGELMKTFDGLDSLADIHTHSFDNGCDGTCNGCDFVRNNDHKFGEAWVKNQTHHYHVCAACGMQKDMVEHTFSAEDDTVCTVCGPLQTPGDLNTDYTVDEDDAIYLLQHVLLSEFFPITQAVDYNGDHKVDEDDAIYLLQHVLLPEYFPL